MLRRSLGSAVARGWRPFSPLQDVAMIHVPLLEQIPAAGLAYGTERLCSLPLLRPNEMSARCLHSSPAFAALGVVEQLHDEVAIALPADSSRSFWEVVEFRPDGSALETWKTPEVLRLHPRDVHLFASETGLSHRAMIAPRAGAILFRTEAAKAIIYADRAILFPARRLSDTVRMAQAVKSALTQRSALPFELKVLESLLAETTRAFDTKSKRLALVAEAVVDDINRNFHASAAELQRFIPVTRKLNEMQHDVKETLDAIADVANYDDQLRLCCLQERNRSLAMPGPKAQYQAQEEAVPPPDGRKEERRSGPSRGFASSAAACEDEMNGRHVEGRQQAALLLPGNTGAMPGGPMRTPHMRMAARILEAYEFKLLSTQSALNEQIENMEQTRTVWHMQLDSQRNRVLRVNLLISVASLGGLMSTLPAAFFGMNLDSGLEDVPGMFWPVVQGSTAAGIGLAGLVYFYYKLGPKRRYAARLRDMRSLRDLLFYHMDDLDAIIDAVKAKGSLTKSEFKKIVDAAVKGRPMSPEEVALLFRVLDSNKDAVLELSELVRMEELSDHLSEQLAPHTS